MFFQKGTPAKEIWFYEHQLPEGQKSYSKTKIIQFDEFAPMIKWWGKRGENEVAWRVNIGDLKNGFDLDVKNHSGAGQAVPRLIATLPPNLQERVTAFRKAVRLEPSLDEWDILSAIARICA